MRRLLILYVPGAAAPVTPVSSSGAGGLRVTWTLSAGETGSPFFAPDHAAKEVMVAGTLAGTVVNVLGALDPSFAASLYRTLNDPQGSPLSFSAAGLRGVQESLSAIAPEASGGSGSGLTVTVVYR